MFRLEAAERLGGVRHNDAPTTPVGNVRHEPQGVVDQLHRMQMCRFEIGQFRPDVIGHKLLAGRETEQIAGQDQGPGWCICPSDAELAPSGLACDIHAK